MVSIAAGKPSKKFGGAVRNVNKSGIEKSGYRA
jgi:hypothetical protein